MKITELPKENIVIFESDNHRICGHHYQDTQENYVVLYAEKKQKDAMGTVSWTPEGEMWFSIRTDNTFLLDSKMGTPITMQIFLSKALPEILETLLNQRSINE